MPSCRLCRRINIPLAKMKKSKRKKDGKQGHDGRCLRCARDRARYLAKKILPPKDELRGVALAEEIDKQRSRERKLERLGFDKHKAFDSDEEQIAYNEKIDAILNRREYVVL